MTDDIERRTREREAALTAQISEQRRLASIDDYIFDKSQEAFWDLLDGTLHTEKSVDASIPIERWRVEIVEAAEREAPPADLEAPPRRGPGRPPGPGGGRRREKLIPPSKDIMRVENDRFVEGSTWWPGQEQIIRDMFIDNNGFYPSAGRRIYNQYKPPPVVEPAKNDDEARPWIEHVKRLWPAESEHNFFFDYCAHMLQFPAVKCNTAIILSGKPGIGKDAALVPVKTAVGSWNTKGIDPDQLFAPFQPWLQTLMLVIDEVRPSKDEFHASSMYNILKPLIAAPPHTLPLNEKNAKLRYVINVMRVFATTNDWMAMYIPPEDRRMFIMHSALDKGWHVAVSERYFVELFAWLESEEGSRAVASWLMGRDLSKFDPKAESPRTTGWEAVAGTWAEPEDGLAFALDHLGNPDVVFASELVVPQFDSREEIERLSKSPRKLGHRMQKAGYVLVKPPHNAERWTFVHGENKFRSRLAFAKQGLAARYELAVIAVENRGQEIVKKASKRPEDRF